MESVGRSDAAGRWGRPSPGCLGLGEWVDHLGQVLRLAFGLRLNCKRVVEGQLLHGISVEAEERGADPRATREVLSPRMRAKWQLTRRFRDHQLPGNVAGNRWVPMVVAVNAATPITARLAWVEGGRRSAADCARL